MKDQQQVKAELESIKKESYGIPDAWEKGFIYALEWVLDQ